MWWRNRQIVLPSWKATDAGTFSSQNTERPGWCTLATWSHLLLVIFNQMITSTVSCYAGQLLNHCECAHCVANIPVCIPCFFCVFFDWQLFIANLYVRRRGANYQNPSVHYCIIEIILGPMLSLTVPTVCSSQLLLDFLLAAQSRWLSCWHLVL